MDIAIPTPALGIITLLGFFSTYGISFLNGVLPFVTKPWQKKVVSVAVAVVLAVVVIVFYVQITGEPIGDPWAFAILSIVIIQAAYALVTRDTGAKKIEASATRDTTEGV